MPEDKKKRIMRICALVLAAVFIVSTFFIAFY